jgi:hypothetical protein
MLWGVSQTIEYKAWDVVNGQYKTGDAANHTLSWIKDGTAGVPTNSPVEVNSTNNPGTYKLVLTAAECQAYTGLLDGKSSSTGVVLIPSPANFVRLPDVAPGAAGGIGDTLRVNGVLTTSVTTVNANIGTTQPVNFTGTGASALAKSDAVDVAGQAQTPGDLYPALSNIAVTSAALNAIAASAVYTTGTDSGGVANTNTVDGIYDSVADSAGTVDFYYQFSLGSTNQVAVGVNWSGYVAGAVNTIKVYAYNWVNATWDQVGTIVGISGTTNMTVEWELTTAHTGTGGNVGLVRIRFNATGLVASTTKTDRILCGYAVTPTYQSGDAFTRLGAPVGASTAADIAAIKAVADAIKPKTDNLPASPASTTNITAASGVALTAAYDPAKTAAQAGDAMALTSGERTTLTAAIWNALTSGMTTAGSIAKLIKDYLGGGSKVAATVASGDDADAATLLSRFTAARAGYLDNLNVGGVVASHADIAAINQSASKHLLIQTVGQYERPESGTTAYTVEVRTYDASTGAAVNADSTPVVTATGQSSGDLSSKLGAGTNPATGVYRYTYTVANTDTGEPLRFDVSTVINGTTFTLSCYTQVVDEVSQTWTSTDRSMLTAAYNKLPANNIADETLVLAAVAGVQSDTDDLQSKFGTPAGGSLAADVAAVKADTAAVRLKTDNLPASPAAVGSAMTLTAAYDAAKTAMQAGAHVQLATTQDQYAPAKAGDQMDLISAPNATALLAIANKVESEIIDETDSERVLQAIVDKIAAANPSLDDLTLSAIASACRDAILDRLLAGNHDTPGTPGKLLQTAATEAAATTNKNTIVAAVGTPLQAANYTAPPAASTISAQVAADLATAHGAGAWTDSGGPTLSAEDIRAALGMAEADMDTQLGGLSTQIDTRAAPGAEMALTSDTQAAVAAAVLAGGDIDGLTLTQVLRVVAALLAGGVSGATVNGGTIVFQAVDGSKVRVTSTCDRYGNRTLVIVDAE